MNGRILVVDDSEVILAATKAALIAAGYHVQAALTLAELDRQLEAETFDLVLMDVQMPEQEGDAVADTLRHMLGVGSHIYLYSSLPDPELHERAQLAGLDGYIQKTAGIEVLVKAVKAAFVKIRALPPRN